MTKQARADFPDHHAGFVCQMEHVLALYHGPCDPSDPMVRFDETCKQLIQELRRPTPARPGQVRAYDYECERTGARNLFLFFEPLIGRRHVKVTERRTKTHWGPVYEALGR